MKFKSILINILKKKFFFIYMEYQQNICIINHNNKEISI